MSVNVALCGSIPRSYFLNHNRTLCGLQALSSRYGDSSQSERFTKQSELGSSINSRPVLTDRQSVVQECEAPAWAVPAKGETRLEPVCEGLGRQSPVDLTRKSLYRVGRSPNSDIQLIHVTSSRRHAMLFHHSNGSCYLVDCGSIHGTFVNGVRIPSPSNGGLVVPFKVRRGAMIRFGGPGAPCFVLKSFSFRLDDEVGVGEDDHEPDMGDLVRRNTRLNALGPSAAESIKSIVKLPSYDDFQVRRKRSFDSLSTTNSLDEAPEHYCKRSRCNSPPSLSESSSLRFVSPEVMKRHVHFSSDPPKAIYTSLVTPEDSFSAKNNDSVA